MTDQTTRRGIRRTVIVLLVFIVLVLAGFINKITTPRVLSPVELQINGAILFELPRSFESLDLVDHRGQPFTKDQLTGGWSLVFFGFTHCPDVCPTTLAQLSAWYKGLAPDVQADTRVILVTVDPARDTPEVLGQYVPYFHPDFIGLTGEFLPIKRFANQLNVAFNKVLQGDDYTMDHSALVALINPRGDYHGFFKPPLDPAKLTLTYQSMRTDYQRNH